MRISIKQLRRIIKEEVARLHENSQDDEPISGRIPADVLAKYAGKIAADAGYKGTKSAKTAKITGSGVSKPAKTAKVGEHVIYSNPKLGIKDMVGTIEFVESYWEGVDTSENMFMPDPSHHAEVRSLGFNPSLGISLEGGTVWSGLDKGSKSTPPATNGENMIYNNPRIPVEDILGTIEFVESEGEDMFMPHPDYHDELENLGFNVSRGLSLDAPAEVKPAGSWGGVSSKPKPKPKAKGRRAKVWYPDEEFRSLNPIVGTIVHDSFEGVDMLTPEDPEVLDKLSEIGIYIDEDGLGLYADQDMVPGIIIKYI